MKLFGFNTNKKENIEQPIVEQYNHDKFYSVGRETIGNYDYSIPAVTEILNNNYIYFGTDNQYPNLLNNLYYSSPFHASIVDFKRLSLIGGGYTVEAYLGSTQGDLIAIKKMEYLFDETMLNEITTDLLIHNRICLKITWNKEHNKIVKIVRVEPANVRATKKVDGKIKKYVIGDFQSISKGLSSNYTYIPAFDTFNKDEVEQLYVWQGYSPGLNYYAQPVYANAVNWLYLDAQISYYHKSNMENSINPSVVLKFPEKFANSADEQTFTRNLKKSFASAKNAGKAMVFFANGRDFLPEIEVLPGNQLGDDFAVTNDTIIRNISMSHTISPLIMGISTPGSLGQSTELEISYKIFTNTFTKPNQKTLNNLVNFFYKINGIKGEFKLNELNILI
jgi:hypothetical protein